MQMIRQTRLHLCRCAAIILALVTLAALPSAAAAAGDRDLIMILSQAPKGKTGAGFIDLGPFLKNSFDSIGRYRTVLFSLSDPAVSAAVDSGKLTSAELMPPISFDTAHKVAVAIGARGMLVATGQRTKDGVAVNAQLDLLIGVAKWTTVFCLSQPPYHTKDKKAALLESIHAQVAIITEKVTGSWPALPANDASTESNAASNIATAPKTDAPKTDATPKAGTSDSGADTGTPGGTKDSTAKAAISSAPARLDVLVDRFRRQGDTANVIVSLRRAVTEHPRDVNLRRQLVAAYQQRGWAMAARDEARRAVALSPDDPVLHRMLGDGLLASGDNEGAIREFNEAVRLGPKDADTFVALGDALFAAGHQEEAQKSFEAGAQADAHNPLPFRRLGVMLARQNRLSECLKAMTEGHKLTSPDAMDGYTADYLVVLDQVRANIADGLAALQAGRKGYTSGSTSAEQAFKAVTEAKKHLQDGSDFVADLPAAPGYTGAQALFSQAAAMGVQAAEMTLSFLESQDDALDKNATLMRLEASRQLNEGVARLKTLAETKP